MTTSKILPKKAHCKRIRHYLLCTIPQDSAAFSGVIRSHTAQGLTYSLLNSSIGRIKRETAKLQKERPAAVGVLALPARFSLPDSAARQAFQLAKRRKSGLTLFDQTAACTEYQRKYVR